MSENNRLLLLWQAAITLEGSELDKKIMDARTKRIQNLKMIKSTHEKCNSNGNIILKNSHNEVERSRRAHLRKCIDELKKKLVFSTDCRLNRITMLHVLRKATLTIKSKEKSICNLYKRECAAKNQNAQLKQRLMYLEKQKITLETQYSINMEKRIRNFSECSVNTTSSEESQLDDRFNMKSLIQARIHFEKPELKGKSLSVSNCNSPNSNSSDSGFDDLLHCIHHKYLKPLSLKKPMKIL